MAISKIWLQQPIAFARIGGSPEPLSSFDWTLPDLRPRGSAKTSITPADTFFVDKTAGTLRQDKDKNDVVLFKDEDGIRPVCPFFELHGAWEGQGEDETRITTGVLKANGLSLADIDWEIHHANHKAYALTHSDGDRIEAHLRIRGDDHGEHDLKGFAPLGAERPLVPHGGEGITMGMLRAICPSSEFPQVRLRFYAPKGHAYAPKDFAERVRTGGKSKNPIVQLLNRASTWIPKNQIWREALPLLKGRCILNEDAAWPQYKLLNYGELGMALLRLLAHPAATIALLRASDTQLSELLRFAAGPRADVGKLPPGLYASWIGAGSVLSSLGIVDDLGDGIITCRLKGIDKPAKARIVVCPPHFSPDRRPPVSLADDLADKEDRAAPRDPLWVSGDGWVSAQMEIDDLLDRAFETAGASNLDVWAEQRREENESAAVYRGDQHKPKAPGAPIWQNLRELTVMDLPLYQQGVWRHRRNSADEFFEQLIRDDANSPDAENLVATWIRNRDDPLSVYYDKKMPALMRGSDRRPMHLTRRQFAAFKAWFDAMRARQVEEKRKEASRPPAGEPGPDARRDAPP